ncbi:MAG: hypothetical protein GY906_06250 [bacterium]|nr:hypothetical protein [bacterium]
MRKIKDRRETRERTNVPGAVVVRVGNRLFDGSKNRRNSPLCVFFVIFAFFVVPNLTRLAALEPMPPDGDLTTIEGNLEVKSDQSQK